MGPSLTGGWVLDEGLEPGLGIGVRLGTGEVHSEEGGGALVCDAGWMPG